MDYGFKNLNGHDGKFFSTDSQSVQHMIIECQDKLSVFMTQRDVEFSYYIIEGSGYFILGSGKQLVSKGDLVVIPAGTKYTFGGKLKMLLVNLPKWTSEQELIEKIPLVDKEISHNL